MLCTIFSASDYGGSGNSAAYLVMQLPVTPLSLARAKSVGSNTITRNVSIGGDLSKLDLDPPPALLRHPSIGSLAEAMTNNSSSVSSVSIVSPNHHTETALAGHSHISLEAEGEQRERETEAMLQDQAMDNQSEEKRIPGTALFYTVHHFFAAPLRFDAHRQQGGEGGEGGLPLEEDGEGDSISRLLANAGPATNTSNSSGSSSAVNDLTALATADSTSTTAALSIATTNGNKDSKATAATTANTAAEIDSSHHETKLLGSARSLEDLLVDRRQLITEQLLRVACSLHNQSGSSTGLVIANSSESLANQGQQPVAESIAGKHVSLQHWAMVMNEAMNLSINWKRFGRYLLDPSAHILRCPVTGLDCVDIEPWLASFEDEISRAIKERDEEEMLQAKQSMHDLSLFIDQTGSSNDNDNNAITIGGEVDPDMVLVSISSLSPSKKPAAEHSPLKKKEEEEQNYHGYKLPEEAIEAIYSQYKLVDAAYAVFDPRDEGQFSMAAFIDGLRQLGLLDHLDEDQNGTDASGYKSRHHSSPDRLFAAMDLYDEELVDRNAFFEVYRLCCLNSLYLADDTAIRPQIKRENTHANQIHRLSLSGAAVPIIMPPNHHHGLHSHQTVMELGRGRTLSVDAELAHMSMSSPDHDHEDDRSHTLGERRNSLDRRMSSYTGKEGSHQPFSSAPSSSSSAIDI